MPISDRDYVRGKHPPTCTCKECTNRRLGKLTKQSSDKSRKETPRRTKTISIRSAIPPVFFKTIRGTPLHRIWRKIPPGVHKLFLSLLVIAGLVDIIRRGYTLFAHQTDPIKNTIIFLVEVGLWIWIVVILRSRRYRYRQPKFKLVLITIIAITLVCTFAGIEPLSSYKDNLFNSISDYVEEWQVTREAEIQVAEAARIEAEKAAEKARAEMEAQAIVEAERKAKEVAEQEVQKISEMEQNVVELVNGFRSDRGFSPLLWDDKLYAYSKSHSKNMAEQKSLFHSSMDKPYAENAWGGEGSTRWTAATIVDSWMSSPKHRTWLLCPRLRHVAVGIYISNTGMYASWTFWRNEPAYEDWWYQESNEPPDWWY